MNIEGTIRTSHTQAKCVAAALQVDNLASMHTTPIADTVETVVCSSSLRTVIASVDDYLMNLVVAEELCSSDSW
ncbi:MAG: hypothetical protein LUQ13_04915 [Methanomicrobiales archaeon]|nr:hypothetical protein [Methanomicrobiales archaeon]